MPLLLMPLVAMSPELVMVMSPLAEALIALALSPVVLRSAAEFPI